MRFFKDGVQIGANKTLNGTIKTTAADGRILIGVDANGTTLWWDGYIDEIRISNNARHTANYTAAALGYVFAASGTIFGPVLDFGRGGVRACLSPELDLVPADTSITLKARAATDADDLSTTIGDFSEFPAVLRPCGRFHQYAAVLAASDRTVSPVIASLLGFGRGPSRGGGSR